MTQKRALLDQSTFSIKKARITQEADSEFSIVQCTGSSICFGCDNQNKLEDCIRKDLRPEEYFNLAAIIMNPSQLFIYPESGKTEQLLRKSAGTLNTEEIYKVLSMIHAFVHHYESKEIIEKIDYVLENFKFHQFREEAYVVGIVNSLKKTLNSEVVRRIRENDSESLKDILLLNPRLSRLVSLLAITVREDESKSTNTSIVYDVVNDSDEEVEHSSSLSIIDTTTALSYSELSTENDDSYLILPVPSQPIPDSPQTNDNTANSSQSSSSNDLFTQPSFSVYENTESSQVSIPPQPNYDELSTDEIRAKIRSYGFKPANRLKMISYLEQLRLCTKLTSSQTNNNNSSLQNTDSQNTSKKVIQYLRSQEDLWTKIVNYEQLDIDELYKNIDFPCKKNELKSILDEYGAIIKKAARVKK